MKKNTKITSFVLVMLLILQIILQVVTNIEVNISNATTTEEEVTYSYSGTTLTITGSGIVTDNWKYKSELANYIKTVETVVFNSDEITAVGDNAFRDCTALTTITYTNHAITSIGNHAFSGCISLVDVIIPNSCKVIGNYAFYKCTSLKSVTIGNTYVDEFKLNEGYTKKEGLEKIGNYAFYGCTSLSEFGLELRMIGYASRVYNRTVYNMLNLNLNSIGDYAFYGCTNLGVFTLNENIKYKNIGRNAFDDSIIVRYPVDEFEYNGVIEINKEIEVYIPKGGRGNSKSETLISNMQFLKGDKVYVYTLISGCSHKTNSVQIELTNQDTNEVTQWITKHSGEEVKNNSNPVHTERYDCVVIPKDGKYKIDVTVTCEGCSYGSNICGAAIQYLYMNRKEYPVTYNGNGNTGGNTEEQTKVHDEDLILNNNEFTKVGYTFQNWNTKADGRGTKYEEGGTYTINEKVTLYAQWKINQYKLTINPNGGIWNKSEENQILSINYKGTKEIIPPIREGYIFEGWTLEEKETESKITSLGEDKSSFTMGYGDATLTANWKKIEYYDLEVEPNGGSWEGSTKSQKFTMNYGGTREIPVPSKNSYHFTKWILAGEGSHITDASANHSIFTMGDENAKLTAEWELITHSIKGNVIWNDQENAYRTRPSEGVQVILKSDEPVTAEGALQTPSTQKVQNGEYTFKNLQTKKEKDNTNYEYTVSQNKVLGYETIIDGYNIINNLIVPSYTSQIKTIPIKGDKFVKNKEVQVEGTIIASDYNKNKVGLCEEEVSFRLDEGIKVDKNSIKISYIDKDGTTKNITKYTVEGNTIKVKFESNKTSNVTAGDSIKIEVKGTLEEVKTYTNTISYSGNLREYKNGEKTDINLGVVTEDIETIENVLEKTNKLTINLKDIETEEYIEGAVLQIIKKTEENGKIKEEIIKEWTTGKEDKIYEELPEGDYIIREIKLPENNKGYVKLEDKPIKVEEDKEQIIELKQDYTKVILEIIDEETKEKIDDVEIEVINKETGEVIKVKETEEGYIIEKVPEGDYIVKQKTPEGYQEIEDIEITIDGTGKTQIKTVENKKLVYDMQVEKELESIWVNGEKKNIRKGNMQKIEIKESKIKTEDIKLEYVIRVSNVGEVKATIGNIIDNLPEGFKLVSTDWKQEGSQAIWDAKTEELNPRESKEVRITIQWENNVSNFGEKKNTAEIKESTNPYDYEDKNRDNNVGEEVTIFSIKTGSEEILTIIKVVDSTLAACLIIYLIVNKKIRSRNVKE